MDRVCKQTRESRDRILRRWEHFCEGIGVNLFLSNLSTGTTNIIIKSFLECHSNSEFNVNGRIRGQRATMMVVSYVRNTTSQLCTALRNSYEADPIHNANGRGYIPVVKEFIKSLEGTSPPEKKQRAITPKFLRNVARNEERGKKQQIGPHPGSDHWGLLLCHEGVRVHYHSKQRQNNNHPTMRCGVSEGRKRSDRTYGSRLTGSSVLCLNHIQRTKKWNKTRNTYPRNNRRRNSLSLPSMA